MVGGAACSALSKLRPVSISTGCQEREARELPLPRRRWLSSCDRAIDGILVICDYDRSLICLVVGGDQGEEKEVHCQKLAQRGRIVDSAFWPSWVSCTWAVGSYCLALDNVTSLIPNLVSSKYGSDLWRKMRVRVRDHRKIEEQGRTTSPSRAKNYPYR